jgi:hypothetical protein
LYQQQQHVRLASTSKKLEGYVIKKRNNNNNKNNNINSSAVNQVTSVTPSSSSSSSTTPTTATTVVKESGCRISSSRSSSTNQQQQQQQPKFKKQQQKRWTTKIISASSLIRAGIPLVLFSIFSSWVVSNALHGKLKEMEISQGKVSKSIRQVKMEQEHEDMMNKLQHIVQQDFDNTKRIQRPHEILEERRKLREQRNVWYRRLWRYISTSSSSPTTTTTKPAKT